MTPVEKTAAFKSVNPRNSGLSTAVPLKGLFYTANALLTLHHMAEHGRNVSAGPHLKWHPIPAGQYIMSSIGSRVPFETHPYP